MAAYAITKEDSDNSLLGSYIYTVPRTSTATSEPTIGSLDSLLELNLSPELKEQLESARSAITAEAEENVTGATAATIPSPFDDALTPPDDFHGFISRDVMNSIHLISPHSLSNQFALWNFLLDLTKVKTLEHAVRLLSSSSMNHSIRDPFSRLFDYIASFSKTCRRLSELDIPQKQLILEFLKNLKPDSISSTLKKAVDFKQIHSLPQLIQETHQLLTVHLEHSSRLKAAEPSSNRNTNQRRSFQRFSNPRNSPRPRSSPSNSRSNYSSPAPSTRFNTPRSEPRTPLGHYASECRSPSARTPNNTNYKRRNPRNPTHFKTHNTRQKSTAKASQPANVPKPHISSFISDSDFDTPNLVRTSAKGLFKATTASPLLELDVLVGTRKVRGLIDTGCIKSCITADLIDENVGHLDHSKVNEFEVADGRIVKSQGRYHTKLSLLMGNESPKRVHLEVKLPVLSGKNQLLIGCDILKCLGVLTADGLNIRINDKRNTLSTAEDDFDHLIQSPPKALKSREKPQSKEENFKE
ncbi:hypothetical protein GEMRC1_007890 [Eukaryota sp. GEM-RC1]